MVVVLRTGVVCGPGNCGTGVSDVVDFDVHRGPETRSRERLNFLIHVQAQSKATEINEIFPLALLALGLDLYRLQKQGSY